jgi:DNA-damage-inducible protein J
MALAQRRLGPQPAPEKSFVTLTNHCYCHSLEMKTLQIRINDDLRDQADSILDEMGLDLSTAVRLFLKKVVQSRSIPFALEAGPCSEAEVVPVDAVTQAKMDEVAKVWHRLAK